MKSVTRSERVTVDPSAANTFSFRPYWQMMKPTIGLLVIVTAVPTMLMAAPAMPDPLTVLLTLLGTFIASSSAGIFNHLVDSDIDGSMERTRERPMPAGKAHHGWAFVLGVVLGVVSFAMLYWGASPLAAWLALAANAFYVVVYTMILKRRTPQNIVIGGAAGAVGPLIGWAAVTNSLSLPAWLLFLIIFLWTPPHFWALAIKYRNDYARVGVPMLPSVAGLEATRWQIFLYSLALIPPTVALWAMGYAGWFFGITGMAVTLRFVWMCYQLWRQKSEKLAMPVFYFSMLYIFGVFGLLTIDRLLALIV